MKKPLLSFWDIWNMSFGFLGIQFGFALQNANASRILQSFGADTHQLSWFWLVAPITGMIIQPIIGHYSDRTWTRLGRRRPYFLGGAIAASIGLILMPNSGMLAAFIPALWVGAGMLMIMDASFNIAMEPFRALVADKLNTEQRTLGFSVQTVLIGVGAVIGSWLPYILAEWFGVAKDAAEGDIPMNVIWSFVIGAIILITTIIWTVTKTSEYSPEEIAQFDDAEEEEELESKPLVRAIIEDFGSMPKTMRQLGLVQFCSWFALFGMWVFATPAVAQHIFGLSPDDTSSITFQDAGNWVGIIFGVYNLVSAFYAFMLPSIAGKLGRKKTHSVSLMAGAVGLISIYFVSNQYVLILSMIGVGIAWASILAMPYAILAGSIPAKKMGIYMGIFNFFITFPQIVNGLFGGLIVKYLYGDQAVFALVTSGVFLLIGAIAVLYVEDKDDLVAT
jgi:maltose/moltooligosaccharide transporter